MRRDGPLPWADAGEVAAARVAATAAGFKVDEEKEEKDEVVA
jgi:hypothetical protein